MKTKHISTPEELERLRKAMADPDFASVVRLLLLADARELELVYFFVLNLV